MRVNCPYTCDTPLGGLLNLHIAKKLYICAWVWNSWRCQGILPLWARPGDGHAVKRILHWDLRVTLDLAQTTDWHKEQGVSDLKYLAETKLPCRDFLWSLSWSLFENHKDGDPVLKDCLVRYCWKEAGGKEFLKNLEPCWSTNPIEKTSWSRKSQKG